MAMHHGGTKQFFNADYPRTLFPLTTNQIVILNAEKHLEEYIYQRILNDTEKEHSFLAQQRVYASKPNYHLRRTVKLDPVAEYFIYDIMYRNRSVFRKPISSQRNYFGYRFQEGLAVSGTEAYAAFKTELASARRQFAHSLSFDIASYFNSIYHHDIVHWFRSLDATDSDVDALSQFFQQINSGRSVDCLPHGLYPCKMIGNSFLFFVDSSSRVKSKQMIRFMDDFYLFDDNAEILLEDFFHIQRLLGEKGLSVNPRKTKIPGAADNSVSTQVDEVKASLLKIRRAEIMASDMEDGDIDAGNIALSKKQREYLLTLLKEETISEEDAELVLRLMHPYPGDVLMHLQTLIGNFPNLAKEIYRFCGRVEDKEYIGSILIDYVKSAKNPTEYVLFWLAKIAEDFLAKTQRFGELLILLYQCDRATKISRAKILEIPENRFGMVDLREEQLKTGQSDWLSWSAAVGTRNQKRPSRNYVLKYFCTGSAMNHLVGKCILDYKPS